MARNAEAQRGRRSRKNRSHHRESPQLGQDDHDHPQLRAHQRVVQELARRGRRIKRKLVVDTNSIRLCTDEMLERFRQIEHIATYLKEKEKEVGEWNAKHRPDYDHCILSTECCQAPNPENAGTKMFLREAMIE